MAPVTPLAATVDVLEQLDRRSKALRGFTPAANIVDEVLGLARAAASGSAYDAQRVYELLGVRTGTSGMSVFADADAKIIGEAVDYVVRAVARPDQAVACAERLGKLLAAYDELVFAGGEVGGALSTFGKRAKGADVSMAFGPATYKGPKWKPLWKDDLSDGKDPKTTRKGDVEGW